MAPEWVGIVVAAVVAYGVSTWLRKRNDRKRG